MSDSKKCDCLNWCGDDPGLEKGKREHCDHYKEARKAEALIESIHWRLPADQLPDNDIVVLGFFDETGEDSYGQPVWPCLLFEGNWLIADGFPTKAPNAWAPMPCGPLNTLWMKVRGA